MTLKRGVQSDIKVTLDEVMVEKRSRMLSPGPHTDPGKVPTPFTKLNSLSVDRQAEGGSISATTFSEESGPSVMMIPLESTTLSTKGTVKGMLASIT